MKKLTFFLGIIIYSLAVFTTSCSSPSTPGDTLKEFSYAMEKGNAEKVISLIAIDSKEMTAEDKEKLTALVGSAKDEIEKKGGIKSIDIIEEIIDEDGINASVKSKTTFGNDKVEEGSSKFLLMDGEWRVKF